MATLPISGTVEFRPNSAAVKAARAELDKAQAVVNAALTAVDGGPDSVTDEMRKAVEYAQKALDAAEEACTKDDPSFTLIVPTARTEALVDYDMDMDPDLPSRAALKDAADGILSEAKVAGLSDEDIASIERAAALAGAGERVAGDDWEALSKAAAPLYSWRKLMAPYKLYANLEAGYRIRRHLVLSPSRKVLSEADLQAPAVRPYLGAINAELVRLSKLSEDDAKN